MGVNLTIFVVQLSQSSDVLRQKKRAQAVKVALNAGIRYLIEKEL